MAKSGRYSQRQRDLRETAGYYVRKFKFADWCVYCGMLKQCEDHVFPVSLAAGLSLGHWSVRSELFGGLYKVPCCNECNYIAGNKPFRSIIDKRHFIQKELRKKHHKKLATVQWSDDEKEDLGRIMYDVVNNMIDRRKLMEKRIFFPILGRC